MVVVVVRPRVAVVVMGFDVVSVVVVDAVLASWSVVESAAVVVVVISSFVLLLGMVTSFIGIGELETIWLIGIGEFGTIGSGVFMSTTFKLGILPKACLFLRPFGPEIESICFLI